MSFEGFWDDFYTRNKDKKKLSEYIVRKKRTISGYGCLTYKVSNGYLSHIVTLYLIEIVDDIRCAFV